MKSAAVIAPPDLEAGEGREGDAEDETAAGAAPVQDDAPSGSTLDGMSALERGTVKRRRGKRGGRKHGHREDDEV